eukprot:4421895-Amphidinium_carterae.1
MESEPLNSRGNIASLNTNDFRHPHWSIPLCVQRLGILETCSLFSTAHAQDLDKLFDIVAYQTETLVTIGSPLLLTRPWCVGEIVTSCRRGLKLVPLYFTGVHAPTEDFISKYMHYVPSATCLAGHCAQPSHRA